MITAHVILGLSFLQHWNTFTHSVLSHFPFQTAAGTVISLIGVVPSVFRGLSISLGLHKFEVHSTSSICRFLVSVRVSWWKDHQTFAPLPHPVGRLLGVRGWAAVSQASVLFTVYGQSSVLMGKDVCKPVCHLVHRVFYAESSHWGFTLQFFLCSKMCMWDPGGVDDQSLSTWEVDAGQ